MIKMFYKAAGAIIISIILSVSGLPVHFLAAASDYPDAIEYVKIFTADRNGTLLELEDGNISRDASYTVKIRYYDKRLDGSGLKSIDAKDYEYGKDPAAHALSGSVKPDMAVYYDAGSAYVEITVKNMKYTGYTYGSNRFYLDIKDTDAVIGGEAYSVLIDAPISVKYFEKTSGSSAGSVQETEYASEIVVENVIVTGADGSRLDRVTKDTSLFNVSIYYAEYGAGLRELDYEDLYDDDSIEAFLTNAGSFIPSGGNRGVVSLSASSSSDAPRFKVEFKNLAWDGASNLIQFQVRYNVSGAYIKGDASTAVFQARAKDEASEDESIPPPTPYIIVDQYSFGEGRIEAGSGFTLDLSFRNTSADIPLENIVMTVATPEDMSIASASNTYYIDALAAGGSMRYSLDLQVKPSAAVGSHNVQIAFSYQYITKKERKENKTTESIAIPVTQIDRFSLDPITEIPGGIVGEAAYLSVSFINRGKTATYNITGFAKANLEIIAPSEHYGNLEAGKSDSIEIVLVPQEAGEMYGEVIVQYEDENTTQKEISVPFTMYVDQPYTPPPFVPPDMDVTEPAPENKLPTIILCSIGGLLMTIPIALYFMKRVKAKGSADLDEEF